MYDKHSTQGTRTWLLSVDTIAYPGICRCVHLLDMLNPVRRGETRPPDGTWPAVADLSIGIDDGRLEAEHGSGILSRSIPCGQALL